MGTSILKMSFPNSAFKRNYTNSLNRKKVVHFDDEEFCILTGQLIKQKYENSDWIDDLVKIQQNYELGKLNFRQRNALFGNIFNRPVELNTYLWN